MKISLKQAALIASIAIVIGAATFYIPQFTPALIVSGIVAVLLALRILENPFIASLLVAFFLPFERIGSLELAGATIRASQIFALLMLASWALYALTKNKIAKEKSPLLIFLPIFWALSMLSIIKSVNVERSILVFVFEFFVMIVALILPNILNTQKKIEKAVRIIILSAVVVSVFGIYQFLGDMLGLPSSITGLREHYTKEVFGFPRVQSTALEPLYFGNFLLIPASIMIGLYLEKKESFQEFKKIKKNSITTIAILGLIVLNILLTVSRGAYLGLAVVLVLSAVLFFKKLMKPSRIIGIAVAGILAVNVLLAFIGLNGTREVEVFTDQITNLSSGAGIVERVKTYEDSVEFISKNPLLGVGIGNFGPQIALSPNQTPSDGWLIVNNIYLEIAAERGIPAVLVFIGMICMLVLRSFRAYKEAQSSSQKTLLVTLTVALVAIYIQYSTFSILYIFHIWFLVGLLISQQNNVFKNKNSNSVLKKA